MRHSWRADVGAICLNHLVPVHPLQLLLPKLNQCSTPFPRVPCHLPPQWPSSAPYIFPPKRQTTSHRQNNDCCQYVSSAEACPGLRSNTSVCHTREVFSAVVPPLPLHPLQLPVPLQQVYPTVHQVTAYGTGYPLCDPCLDPINQQQKAADR